MCTECAYYVPPCVTSGIQQNSGSLSKKHEVEFADAAVALEDENAPTVLDEESESEYGYQTLCVGPSPDVLTVVHTEEIDGLITIISARSAEPSERRQYHEGIVYGY